MASRIESTTAMSSQPFQVLFQHGALGRLDDGQLLEQFLAGQDASAEAAFQSLVDRHGPMVLRICRNVMGDWHDAEDASQAVFLVLARRAADLRRRESTASWLFGVAQRVAGQSKRDASRRRRNEERWAVFNARPVAVMESCDSWEDLYEEIERLPGKYRDAIVLCHLEGLRHDQAASRLGCPVKTLETRLQRAKARLRERLIRRGLAPSLGLLAAEHSLGTASAALPPALRESTVQAAMRLAAGKAVAGLVPETIITLAERTSRSMLWANLRAGAIASLALSTMIGGLGVSLVLQNPKGHPDENPVAQAQVVPAQEPPKPVAQAPIFLPLPPREELQAILRKAADEVIAIARTRPMASSSGLESIATAQARIGDRDGARTTFEAAVLKALGMSKEMSPDFMVIVQEQMREIGMAPSVSVRALCRIANAQFEAELKDEARATLRRALEAVDREKADPKNGQIAISDYADIAQEQARQGDRENARKTVDRLIEFSQAYLAQNKVYNSKDQFAASMGAALAAVGDFDAAFQLAQEVRSRGNVLGQIALAASRSLDRETAQRFVQEASARLSKLGADETYYGLSDLAEAQARLGDSPAAKQSALAIGAGPTASGLDLSDGQALALLRIALAWKNAGDIAGARETLAEGYQLIKSHERMKDRDVRYGNIAGGQISCGDLDGALQSIDAMTSRRSALLATAALAQAANGQGDAQATLARALAEGDLAARQPIPPRPVLANLPGGEQIPDLMAIATLAELQAKAGNLTEALKTTRSIGNPIYESLALQGIVIARATAGDVAAALKLALEESNSPDERRDALQALGAGILTRDSIQRIDREVPRKN